MGTWTEVGAGHSSGSICAKVFRSKNAPIKEKFDVSIFFGTFESRGLVSSKLLQKNSCMHSVIVFFNEAQDTSLRKKYDPILSSQVGKCSKEPTYTINNVSIKEVEKILEKLISWVPADCWKPEANWFIDLGGSPIPYFLGLLGYLRDIFPCPRLTIFNPTGDYEKEKEGYSFTYGFDKNIWVPRLWGRPDPALPWTYVFLLGFEGSRSYEVFFRCEPDNVLALYGKPGYKPGYEVESIKRNEMFLKESGLWVGNETYNIIESDAADPIETWCKLEKVVEGARGKSNVCFVPLGPKAHALACGLCALADGAAAVLYNMPRAYSLRDVNRGKYLWKYQITL